MSKRVIYQELRAGGMSRAGALGVMGNIGAESAFRADNVQDGMGWSDEEYTKAVNNGEISKYDFCHDSRGYGLCQWTFYSRKEALYDFAYINIESIGDEIMQCRFIIKELQTPEYQGLYNFLCTTQDMYEAVIRVCKEYERPAINNIQARYAIACECANEPYDDEPPAPDDPETDESCEITVRVLRKGDKGRDVFLLQNGLSDMGIDTGIPDGDFGKQTEAAVNQLRRNIGLETDGVANADVWQILFQ